MHKELEDKGDRDDERREGDEDGFLLCENTGDKNGNEERSERGYDVR